MEWIKMIRDTKVPLDEAVLDVAVGFCLVLGVLILLIAIFWVFGKVMVAATGKPKQPKVKAEKPQKAAKAAPAPAPAPAPVSAPIVGDGVDDEVIAVIAAAVAAMAPAGCTYAVRRVERARASRPVWAAAGVLENTRPF